MIEFEDHAPLYWIDYDVIHPYKWANIQMADMMEKYLINHVCKETIDLFLPPDRTVTNFKCILFPIIEKENNDG